MLFADVIIDISASALDRSFQYRIPESLKERAKVGCPVRIPFGKGNSLRKGYIIGIGETPKISENLIKDIADIPERDISIEDTLVSLAGFLRERYGGTMYDALRTVLPVRKKTEKRPKRVIRRKVDGERIQSLYQEEAAKKHKAKARLLEAFIGQDRIPYELASGRMNITKPTIDYFTANGILEVISEEKEAYPGDGLSVLLGDEQKECVRRVLEERGEGKPFLLFGITGSGKTEVYLKVIEQVLAEGKQAIVLIPEIALTYQTLLRFYRCFGDRVGYIHSKMAEGDRCRMIEKAKSGEISVMIGPRSALFTPFSSLGLIVIDEEQEQSYHSESSPKYYADEVAVKRAEDSKAALILGSATPSVKSYYLAKQGVYKLLTLTKRAKEGASLAEVSLVDMRKELASGNRSIFSKALKDAITDCLSKKQQAMLFLNRRGYSGFVSCRNCGEVIKCPHCDISLTLHRSGKMQCHYCGFEQPLPKTCPACESKYIAAFGTGTQKIEEFVKKEFPQARVMRMDADTTKGKDGYETILSAFSEGKADILVGTQMIVKGHDFGNVTLMGVLMADMSLGISEYSAAERTLQLLAQAAGRAGRDRYPGKVIIQTYRPEHYALQYAAKQDYPAFFEEEMRYRKLFGYPPVWGLLKVLGLSTDEKKLSDAMTQLGEVLKQDGVTVLGPAPDYLRYIKDTYREVLFVKSPDRELLRRLRENAETYSFEDVSLQFESSE